MMDPRLYERTIDIPEGACGEWAVRHKHEPAGRSFTTAPLRSVLFGGQSGKTVLFERPTTWHGLYEGESLWMTDIPCEQAQMRGLLKHANGHLLIGGLGLGLAANLACQLPKVTQVTVVEQSADVIALVAPHLRTNEREVKVIRADIFAFLAGAAKSRGYSCALLDTWAGDGEATLFSMVIPLLQLCDALRIKNVACWQEDVMRGQLALQTNHVLLEKLCEPSAARAAALGPKRHVLTQEQLAKEERILWLFPRAVAWDNCFPADVDEAFGCARRFAADFGVPGWLDKWKVDRGLWERWQAEATRLRAAGA